jgi:hypothetical protein
MFVNYADPLTGVNMLFVAFILWVIAGNLRGKTGGKETGFLCILVGALNTITALYLLLNGNPLGFGAFLLFAFTYFFFAMDLLGNADTFTGLGNYALGVAIATIPFSILYFQLGDVIMGIVWLVWGQLWFLFYLANGLKKNVLKFMIADTYVVAIANIVIALCHHMFKYF